MAELFLSENKEVDAFVSAIGGKPVPEAIQSRTLIVEREVSISIIAQEGYDKVSKKRICSCRAAIGSSPKFEVDYYVQNEDGKQDSFIVKGTRKNAQEYQSEPVIKAAGELLAAIYKDEIDAKNEALKKEHSAFITSLEADYAAAKAGAIDAWRTAEKLTKSLIPQVKSKIDTDFVGECHSSIHDQADFLRCKTQEAKNAAQMIEKASMYATDESPTKQDGPGFDCTKAKTTIESMICADQELSALDIELKRAFNYARSETAGWDGETGERSDPIGDEQKTWIHKTRNECKDVYCLRRVYKSRISYIKSNWPSE